MKVPKLLAMFSWLSTLSLAACSERGVKIAEQGQAPGSIVTVDNSGDAGQFVSMDIDVNDNVHLVYYDKQNQSLKYVQWSARGLATSVVDAGCKRCLYATIKVSGKGEPHIAYYSDATHTFTYAYRHESQWRHEPIEWGQGNGMGARLLFDDEYGLHALYYSGDGYLKHAWRVAKQPAARRGKKAQQAEPAGIWGTERVDRANGSEKVQISFVKRPDGGLAASYLHWSGLNSELRFAERLADGRWRSEVVAREYNPGKSSALFYDPEGRATIIFRQALKNRLCLAQRESQGWKTTILVPDAYNMALAADASGDLLLAYENLSGRDPRKGHLRFVMRRAGKWYGYVVDAAPGTGTHLDAVLTASSQPIIAYYEEQQHSLKLYQGKL